MTILSAADAISPAFARTKLVLFSPFRAGRSWKLGATAYLTLFGTIFVPYFLVALYFIPLVRAAGGEFGVRLLIGAVAAALVVYLLLFSVVSRLRFVLFDVVVHRGEFVAPAWRRYGPQSFQWMLFKIVLGTLAIAAVALPTIALARKTVIVVAALQMQAGRTSTSALMPAVFALYGALLLLYAGFGLFYFASSLVSDFVVPPLALERTTLGDALRRMGRLMRRETGQFLVYALLKAGLALVAYMALALGFYFVIFCVVVVVGLVALLIGFLLHLIGVSTAVLTVLAVMLGMACYGFCIGYVMVLGGGAVVVFLESYALYFLGGRYPLLGDLLEASTPRPAVAGAPLPPSFTAATEG